MTQAKHAMGRMQRVIREGLNEGASGVLYAIMGSHSASSAYDPQDGLLKFYMQDVQRVSNRPRRQDHER